MIPLIVVACDAQRLIEMLGAGLAGGYAAGGLAGFEASVAVDVVANNNRGRGG